MDHDYMDAWLDEQETVCYKLLCRAEFDCNQGLEMQEEGDIYFRDRLFGSARDKLRKLRGVLVEILNRCGGWERVPEWHSRITTQGVECELSMYDAEIAERETV